MAAPIVAPYGAWASPLSAARLATTSASIGQARAFGGQLLWTETRPTEGGRVALLTRNAAGNAVEVLPAGFSVRTRVHEYGGLAFTRAGQRLLFVNDADQRLWAFERDRPPQALTPVGLRYADGKATNDGGRAYFVREDHRAGGEPANTVVAFDPAQPGEGTVLYADSDFVAFPRPSLDGTRLAFISWNHPRMPWDGTRLQVGRLAGGALVDLQVVAGSDDESVIEPNWDVDGTLYFLSDRGGWWNLYRWRDGAIEPVTALSAELLAAEMGGPLWQLGQSSYTLLGDGRALACICRNARDQLALIDLARGAVAPLSLPFVAFGSIGVLDTNAAFATAAAEDDLPALITIDLASSRHEVLRRPAGSPLTQAFISRAEPIEYPTAAAGDRAPRSAHAFFYPPCNPDYEAPSGEKPPLLVVLHGGPTGHSTPALNLQRQFWTSRGYAVVDVNYGGSSGFGRDYRRRLRGQWGVVDLADAVAAVRFLVDAGRVDGRRVVIRGGSAGGFTVLCALAFTRPLRRRCQLLRRCRPRAARCRHAQVRKPLSRHAGRPASGGPGGLPRAQPDPPPAAHEFGTDHVSGCRGQSGAARAEPRHRRRRAPARPAGGVSGIRGRAARLSACREHPARAGGRGVFPRARAWIRAGRPCGAHRHRQPRARSGADGPQSRRTLIVATEGRRCDPREAAQPAWRRRRSPWS